MSSSNKKSKPSFQIDDLMLHPNILYKLKEAGLLTFKSILQFSLIELQKMAKISLSEAKTTLEAVSEALVEKESLSVYELMQKETSPQKAIFLSSTTSSSDALNRLYTGTITEISGESGCGKTQMCLHLSILAQLPLSSGGLNSKVIYIHSEGDFPIKRFLQIANNFTKENPSLQALNLSNNLILRKVHNLNAAMHILQNGIPSLLSTLKPELVVIDSVASLLRTDFVSISERTCVIQRFGIEIWKLANVYGLAVVCVNQVSGHIQTNENSRISSMTDVPSLGLLWSNILTTRLKISRKPTQNNKAARVLECIFSSYLPNVYVDFLISEEGIKFL